MEKLMHSPEKQAELKILLYVLTGDQSVLPKLAKKKKMRTRHPEFLSRWKPDVLKDKSRSGGNGPANPNMNERAAWQRERENGRFASRSDQIKEAGNNAKFVRIMSNRQSTFTGAFWESPSHRDMTPDERSGKISPKVGPHHQ